MIIPDILTRMQQNQDKYANFAAKSLPSPDLVPTLFPWPSAGTINIFILPTIYPCAAPTLPLRYRYTGATLNTIVHFTGFFTGPFQMNCRSVSGKSARPGATLFSGNRKRGAK